jgi:formylglycine-generating enzyme required for sulfatase activity
MRTAFQNFPRVRWLFLLLVALIPSSLLALPAQDFPPPTITSPHKTYTETLPGTKVRFDMMAIPAGTFRMGSPDQEKGRGDDEGPQHPVRVRAFWMGKTEVTWDEYDLFWKTTPAAKRPKPATPAERAADAITRPSPPYVDETCGFGREGYPVVGISQHAAMEYCRWLSARTGKLYRLPTEAEWEYACRAGSRSAFFWGENVGELGKYAWSADNSEETTHPVGKKRPNRWGLYDMAGNVAEWCLDHYDKDSYGTFPQDRLTLAPVKLPTAARYPHVVRGGSWADSPDRCRSAARRGSDKSWNRRDPDVRPSIWWLSDGDFVGFRVVRAVEEQENLRGIQSQVTRKSPP